MITLAGDLDFIRSRLLASLAAVFLARLRRALARYVCALLLFVRHDGLLYEIAGLSTVASVR
jgi:hypothetical protein